MSDAQLVERTISGDEAAFDALVSKYRARIYHLALSKVGTREAALDITQDAFVQAYLSLSSLKSHDKFAAWISSIARNLSLMHLRAAREVAMSDEFLDTISAFSCNRMEEDMDQAAVRDALNRLPTATRSAAILYFVEEMKQPEIAEFLGISLPAVKSRIRDARVRLQKEMVDMVRQVTKKDQPGDEFNRNLKHKIELARWYREFADLIANGVPIMTAFDTLRKQDFSEPIKDATGKLMDAVLSGRMPSEALKDLPALNAHPAVGMMRAGEVGGILEWTSEFLADWLEIETGRHELELAFWCRTIGHVIAGGAPVKMALESGFDIVQNAGLKKALRDLMAALDAGESLEPVLTRHAGMMPPIVRVSILAGRDAGNLGHALKWASDVLNARISERLIGREFHLTAPTADWVKSFADAVAGYAHHESPEIRSAAVTILGRLEIKEYADLIIRSTSDEDAEVRRAATTAIAGMEIRDACAELVRCLQDSEAPIRRAAVNALTALELTEAAQEIAQVIADKDQRVSNTASEALEKMGEIGILTRRAIELLADEWSLNRVRALHILNRHPVLEAVDPLMALLGDEVETVRFSSAILLAKFGRRESIPVLLKALEHPHGCFLQRGAAEALAKLGESSAAPHIRRAIEEGRLQESYVWTAEKLEGHQQGWTG